MHCNRSSDQNLYGEMGHQTSAPFFLTRRLSHAPLWSKIEKNTDKIAIQSFTVPRAREWAKWASERTSERCERTSERTSEWPSTFIWVFGWSGPHWGRQKSLPSRQRDISSYTLIIDFISRPPAQRKWYKRFVCCFWGSLSCWTQNKKVWQSNFV